MQLSYNTLSIISIIIAVLFAAPIQAFAVPWASSSSSSSGSGSTGSFVHRHPDQPRKAVFPQLTWLRDTAIEKVFGLPPKPSKDFQRSGGDRHRSTSSHLPSTLLAKYGGDVVLRFNLSTPYEEQALAEAANTLFLDVWEFTSNWADIRLREDDVRPSHYPAEDEADGSRYHHSLDCCRTLSKRHTRISCRTWPRPSTTPTPPLPSANHQLPPPTKHLHQS